MISAIRIISILIVFFLKSAFGAIPSASLLPLFITDKYFLPSGWIITSLTGGQLNGYGVYNPSHLYIPSPMYFTNDMNLSINYGITDSLDFLVSLDYIQNKSSMRNFNYIGDTSITFNYNLVGPVQPKTNLSFNMSLVIPTGKYTNLNPNLYTTDATGAGSYQPSIGMSFSHTFQLDPEHTLTLYSNSGLTYTYRVALNGLSAYGGSTSTIGRMRPGNSINFLIGATYLLTDKWSASVGYSIYSAQPSTFKGQIADNIFEYLKQKETEFESGSINTGYIRPRIIFNGVLPTIHNIGGQSFLGSGSVTSLSITPSLSYDVGNDFNFTFSMSVSTPGGKNTPAFYAPSLSLTKTISSSK